VEGMPGSGKTTLALQFLLEGVKRGEKVLYITLSESESIIQQGGLSIFPRLIAAEHHKEFHGEPISSGSEGLDALLGGGLPRGTSALLIGGAGVGKSTVALSYAVAAAARGEQAILFAFDEGLGTIFARANSLGIPLRTHVAAGRLAIQKIDPVEMSPGEFVAIAREVVEKQDARVVVIDSLNGYINAMPNEKFLILQMHELLSYLNQLGVFTILVLAQQGLMGPMQSPLDLSYLSDTVIMLRYFEADGSVRRALSVVKSGVADMSMPFVSFAWHQAASACTSVRRSSSSAASSRVRRPTSAKCSL
jgi:circadian clock protein KaiC